MRRNFCHKQLIDSKIFSLGPNLKREFVTDKHKAKRVVFDTSQNSIELIGSTLINHFSVRVDHLRIDVQNLTADNFDSANGTHHYLVVWVVAHLVGDRVKLFLEIFLLFHEMLLLNCTAGEVSGKSN